MIKRALISVSDKEGIFEFAKELNDLNIDIISTGNTYKLMKEKGLRVKEVSEITGFEECLDGRVKTLHPVIHAGLLALRENAEHMNTLKKLSIETIDMVIVNLYPFKDTIMKTGVSTKLAIENIDIGGPTMLRSAAKNYKNVVVITDKNDYNMVINEIKNTGNVSEKTRYYLMIKVFELTSHYDSLITQYFKDISDVSTDSKYITKTYELVDELRYGENPHQKAFFYKDILSKSGDFVDIEILHGKKLSYNNINDTNAAIEIIKEFDEITAVAVKHANPCGIGSAKTVYEAFTKAYEGDNISIFGGIIAVNEELDSNTAKKINDMFIEVVVAPSYSKDALDILKQKQNIRILILKNIKDKHNHMEIKSVLGGILMQSNDDVLLEKMECVTEKKPTDKELKDLIFAYKAIKNVKSNAILLAKDMATVAIGTGQVNRIFATRNCLITAADNANGCVLASDAFFPFRDSIDAIKDAGIKAIIQPGGSINDNEVVKACNEHGISMLFTGTRHFKH